MKKAIKYLRFSSDGQSQHSIERQEMITTGWTTHHNFTVVDTFIDEGYSARNFDRPDIKALFTFIKKNYRQIDYLVVAELTRFSREAGDAINMVKQIQKEYGIRIVSASRSVVYDVYDSNSFFMMGLEFLLGNSENIKRQNDINGGIYTAKAEGRWIQGGPAPFGYTKEGTGKDRHLVVRECEAIVVRHIYAQFLNNTPIKEILPEARKMGFRRTSNSAIQEVLQNPLYMGYQDVKSWKDHPGGLFPIKNLPKIIDEPTWYQVKEKFNTKGKNRVSITDAFPLRGILKCHCYNQLTGAPSRSKSGKYINYYNCKTPGHNTINATVAHTQMNEMLSHLSLPQRLIEKIRNESELLLTERIKENTSIMEAKKVQLTETEKKLKSIEEKFILNQLNFDSYNTWNRTLSTERHQLSSSIEELNRSESQVLFLLQTNLSRLGDLQHIYQISTTLQKQELIRQVFDNALYYQNKAYRTPYVMPVFTHNLLTLKQKALLFVDDEMKSPAGWRRPAHSRTLFDLLSFIDTLRVA